MNNWIENFNTYESEILESYHFPKSSSSYMHIEESCAQFNKLPIDKIPVNDESRNGSKLPENRGEKHKQKSNRKKLKIESFLKEDRLSDLINLIEQHKKEQFLFLLKRVTHITIRCLLKRVEKLFLNLGEN